MSEIQFEWNKQKALVNKRKHGVSFEEARTVFYDDDAIQFDDLEHSQSEDRFIMVGMSFNLRVIIVSHCERKGSIIRIISARKATQKESKIYWEGKR